MTKPSVQFRRGRLYWTLPLVVAGGLVFTALTAVLLGGVTPVTISVALVLFGLSMGRTWRAWQWYRHDGAIAEILDYCVIDMRSFKAWVYWQDVKEIIVSDGGTIFLRVENETQYARQKKCICDGLARLFGIKVPSKLMLSPIGLQVRAVDLLQAVRTASRPYGIPITRMDVLAATDDSASRATVSIEEHGKRASDLTQGFFSADTIASRNR